MKIRTFTTPITREDLESARTLRFSMTAQWESDGTFNKDESRFSFVVEVLDADGNPIPGREIKRSLSWSSLPTAAKDEIRAVALRCLDHPDVPGGTDADPTET